MLLEYLHEHLKLFEEFREKLDTMFRHQYVKKGDILFRPEGFSQKIIFIEKGLIRTYYLKDGKDITYLFLSEKSFLAPVECLLGHVASYLYITQQTLSVIRSVK